MDKVEHSCIMPVLKKEKLKILRFSDCLGYTASLSQLPPPIKAAVY